MDPKQRHNDSIETAKTFFEAQQGTIWTAMPAKIVSVQSSQSCSVQPLVQGVNYDDEGNGSFVNYPVIPDVPICWPGGGGIQISFPLAEGDEVLLVHSCREFGAWWQSGGVQPPYELRMHDMSDAFAIPRIRSKPNVPANISAVAAQLRTDDGQTAISLSPGNITLSVGGGAVSIVMTPSGIAITGPMMSRGEITAKTIPLSAHLHENAGGSGNSGAAIP